MKKIEKNSLLRISLILFAIMPLLSKAQSTQGSGAMPNIAIPAAGTGGADHVFIGSNAGKVNIGDRNTFMGTGAGRFNYDQYDNVFIGFNAGFNNGNGDTEPKAMLNTFVGSQCGFSNTLGGNNTFLGFKAGYTNTLGDANTYLGTNAGFAGTGYSNVCVGWQSGFSNTADYNAFSGTQAGFNNTAGSYNCVLGTQSGYNNATGAYNTIMGFQAGYGGSGNHSNNSFFGFQAGYAITSGGNNVFLGYTSGLGNTTGANNVFLGYDAGSTNTTGSSNTVLGYNTDLGSSALTNASAIGANAIVKNSNHMILGDNSVHVGINLSNDATGPLSTLSIGDNGNALYEVYSFNPSSGDGCVAIKGEIDASLTINSVNKVYANVGVVNAYYGFSYGTYGSAYKTTAHQAGRAYGVYGIAGNCTNLHNYGVYGTVVGSNTGFAVYADGLLRTTNDGPEKLTSGTWAGYSDERLKTDIEPFTDGLDVLRQIDPVTYKFNGIGGLDDSTTFIGVIAQDVQEVAPYCVGTTQLAIKQEDGAEFVSDIVTTIDDSSSEYVVNVMNYDMTGLLYVMMNSIKELDSTVTALQNQVDEANQRVIGPDSAQNNLPVQQVTLSSQRAILYQNTPNPAGDETTINYYISEGAANAEMVFYDAYGKEIKRVALVNQGNASLVVNTQDLDAGVYSYSLVVDGKIIDTLKLVRVK